MDYEDIDPLEHLELLPWNTVTEGKSELREAVLNLSKDCRNLLTEPPETSNFEFDLNSFVPKAKVN